MYLWGILSLLPVCYPSQLSLGILTCGNIHTGVGCNPDEYTAEFYTACTSSPKLHQRVLEAGARLLWRKGWSIWKDAYGLDTSFKLGDSLKAGTPMALDLTGDQGR